MPGETAMPESAYSEQPEAEDAITCAVTTDAMVGPDPSALQEPVIDTHVEGDRVVVTIRGELDLGVDQWLRQCLRSALARSVRGIDLDLYDVGFCDCSALNVLLTVRRQALAESKTVTIRAVGPAVERVLELTDVLSLFTAHDEDGPDREPAAPSTDHAPAEPDATEEDLRIEVVQLRRAMQTRPTIDLARGLLMAGFGLSPDEALTALVMASQNTNTKLHHLAQGLVDTVKGPPLPESVQRQLSAAVARVSGLHAAEHQAAKDAVTADVTAEPGPDQGQRAREE
ncbi:ANTAR domain-containing protein [Streptomyces sp. NPDC087903]|uniref:ANTAR domain-containing protein n=1 Tax=Streptomyces sp. NPDC087903 TaxID=3365819 RepID=UPI003827EE4E